MGGADVSVEVEVEVNVNVNVNVNMEVEALLGFGGGRKGQDLYDLFESFPRNEGSWRERIGEFVRETVGPEGMRKRKVENGLKDWRQRRLI